MDNDNKDDLGRVLTDREIEKLATIIKDELRDEFAIKIGNTVIKSFLKVIGILSISLLYYLNNHDLLKF